MLLTTLLAVTLLLTGCGKSKQEMVKEGQPEKGKMTYDPNLQITPPETGDQIAIMETDKGKIYIKLFPELVPETVKNFVELSKTGKYNGVRFHRVIKNFMIQTGDFEKKNGTGGYSYNGPGTVIPDEFHPALTHRVGAVSMANRGSNTGGSQFFIIQNKDGTSWLNRKHAVFGQVYDGMKVVDAIADVTTGANDAPVKPIKINKITITTYQ